MSAHGFTNPLDLFGGAGLPGDPMEDVLSLQSLGDNTEIIAPGGKTDTCSTGTCGSDTDTCVTGSCTGNTTGCSTRTC